MSGETNMICDATFNKRLVLDQNFGVNSGLRPKLRPALKCFLLEFVRNALVMNIN